MSAIFDEALQLVLWHEGGFVNHPRDPGGATNLGITLKTLRKWHAGATIDQLKSLTRQQAADIYRAEYWRAPRIGELPDALAAFTFDGAVNHGPARAVKFLQGPLGVSQDGQLGPVTLAAAQNCDQLAVLAKAADARMTFYTSLTGWDDFGKGWARRLVSVLGWAAQIAG